MINKNGLHHTVVDITGKKFGKLTVLKFHHKEQRIFEGKKAGSEYLWECKCDCGNIIITRGLGLKQGGTLSCGCSKIYKHEKGSVGFRLLYNSYISGAKRRGIEFKLTVDQFKLLTKSRCFYCGSEPLRVMKSHSKWSEYLYNGIDRIDSSLDYSPGNVVPCCSICNWAKSDMNREEFLLWIEKVYKNRIKQKFSLCPSFSLFNLDFSKLNEIFSDEEIKS